MHLLIITVNIARCAPLHRMCCPAAIIPFTLCVQAGTYLLLEKLLLSCYRRLFRK